MSRQAFPVLRQASPAVCQQVSASLLLSENCWCWHECRYDPDEIEEEQRERERRNQINRQFNQFVKRVQQDVWERDFG